MRVTDGEFHAVLGPVPIVGLRVEIYEEGLPSPNL